MTLLAWHNNPAIKARYLKRVRAHAAADEIVKGQYWKGGKGCAVGCCIHSDDHTLYETKLGIPIALAHLEDKLFESLPNKTAKAFPERFLMAAKVGADLSCVHWQFLHWLLTEELVGRDHPAVHDAIKECAAVLVPLMHGKTIDSGDANDASEAAHAASETANDHLAAFYAARAASEAASAAAYALSSRTGYYSYTVIADETNAVAIGLRRQFYAAVTRMAEKLLQLMESAPIPDIGITSCPPETP